MHASSSLQDGGQYEAVEAIAIRMFEGAEVVGAEQTYTGNSLMAYERQPKEDTQNLSRTLYSLMTVQ